MAQRQESDRLYWSHTRDGNYLVRSGYHLATNINGNFTSPSHGDPYLKSKIWTLPIQPKIKHFLWRVVSRSIGTTTRLGTHIDKTCQHCCLWDESINHLFYQCPISISTRRLLHPPLFEFSSPSLELEDNIRILLDFYSTSGLSEYHKLLPFWDMWCIWKSRNNLIFNKQIPNPLKDVEFAGAEVKVWLDATHKTSTTNQSYHSSFLIRLTPN